MVRNSKAAKDLDRRSCLPRKAGPNTRQPFHHQTTWRVALVQHLLSCTGLSTDLHVLVIDKPKLDRSMGLQVHGTNSTTYILDQRQHFTFAFSSSVHSLSGLVVAIGSSFVSHFSKKNNRQIVPNEEKVVVQINLGSEVVNDSGRSALSHQARKLHRMMRAVSVSLTRLVRPFQFSLCSTDQSYRHRMDFESRHSRSANVRRKESVREACCCLADLDRVDQSC